MFPIILEKEVVPKELKVILNEILDICYDRYNPEERYRNAWIGTVNIAKSRRILELISKLQDYA